VHLGASKRAARDRAAEVLDLFGMPKPKERLNDYPHQLSGGLRQRAVIAMALACEPRLLIADEPTTALDVSIQAQILGLLDDLIERLNMGLLLITHDMGVVADRTDRVMVMYAGQVVESSDTWTLFNEIRHPYAQALLESIPDLDMDRSRVLYSIPGLPPSFSDPPPGCRFAARCRYAQPNCVSQVPPVRTEGTSHRYSCFFPVGPADRPAPAQAEAPETVQGSAAQDAAEPLSAAPDSAAPEAVQPAAGVPLLTVQNLVKEFPVRRGVRRRKAGSVKAVSDVSLEIMRGETFGLVGESGSGKTTIGRLIMALEKPDSGVVTFDGEDLSKLKGRALRRKRREFQLMFQDPYASLDPRMRTLSILREPLASQAIGTRQEQIGRVRRLLHEVGLSTSVANLYPHQFSGGQRQRIGLARALVVEPRLVIADEPVSALDVSVQSQVLNMMKRLQAEHHVTYLVISHDLSVVRYLADRIGVLYLGKLVEVGPGDDVYSHPAHPYTAGLLASIPGAAPARQRRKHAAAMPGELPSASDPPSGCRFRTRCPRAAAICGEKEPVMQVFSERGHQAACHFPLIERPDVTAATKVSTS
jgi:peptide/nickel transport system ATP-binding protein